MTKETVLLVSLLVVTLLFSCGGKPSEEDISKKILQEYVCSETANVNDLKILRTEKTESTGEPPVFRYTVRGEVAWPEGCAEMGITTVAGKKEKFAKQVTLYKTEAGDWQ